MFKVSGVATAKPAPVVLFLSVDFLLFIVGILSTIKVVCPGISVLII